MCVLCIKKSAADVIAVNRLRQKSDGGVGKQAVGKHPCPKGKYLCTFENMLPLIPT